MRGFIAGVIITLLVLFGIGLAIADLGFLPTNADATPSGFEQKMVVLRLAESPDEVV